ncbi:MAG: exodeoxyribonuclease VII large subunit [Fibrobacterales bacterium]
MAESKSYSVTQYCTSIQKLLKQRVPEIWVHGVISQLNIRGRVVYLQMAEYKEDDSRPVSTLSLMMFTSDFEAMNTRLSKEVQPFRLEVDLKVSLLLEADFYVPSGKFQARIKDIDPNFTLGELAVTRKKILEMLKGKGLFDKNREHVLSITPLKLGLITAEGSAAHNDFMEIINQSDYAFDIQVVSAKMQGTETEPTVLKALRKLAKQDLDVVCICRGGGSKTDLVYFDSEALCVEIANYPMPVLTGIGHQIDTSLVDLVAWDNKITPTACARFLVEQLDAQWQKLVEIKRELRYSWEVILQSQSDAIYTVGKGILTRAPQLVTLEREKIKRHTIGLQRGPIKLITHHQINFESVRSNLHHTWNNFYQTTLASLKGLGVSLTHQVDNRIKEEQRAIIGHKSDVTRRWDRERDIRQQDLKGKGALLRSLDPKRTLERGYSISKIEKKDGKSALAHFSGLSEGDILVTEFKDGAVFSKITGKGVS